MSDMKNLMENWRGYEESLLNEVGGSEAADDFALGMGKYQTDTPGEGMRAMGQLFRGSQEEIEKFRETSPWKAAAAEIVAGFTPAGVAVDISDISKALETGDGLGVALAGIGFIPGGGDAFKAVARGALRKLRRSVPEVDIPEVSDIESAMEMARKIAKETADNKKHMASELDRVKSLTGGVPDIKLSGELRTQTRKWTDAGGEASGLPRPVIDVVDGNPVVKQFEVPTPRTPPTPVNVNVQVDSPIQAKQPMSTAGKVMTGATVAGTVGLGAAAMYPSGDEPKVGPTPGEASATNAVTNKEPAGTDYISDTKEPVPVIKKAKEPTAKPAQVKTTQSVADQRKTMSDEEWKSQSNAATSRSKRPTVKKENIRSIVHEEIQNFLKTREM
jgi:hypothetical protein